ncbi:MAG: hypothetical protein M1822_003011 [Bathelium mastoideum]|nr:MAG: hypothetical protein M1822_003011 [Bathelium mastoideum]
MKETMRSRSRTPPSSDTSRNRPGRQQDQGSSKPPSPEPEKNVIISYLRQEPANQNVTFDSLSVAPFNADPDSGMTTPSSPSGATRRTGSVSSMASFKSVASVVKVGLRKLSSTLKPQDGDPPSDYQRFAGASSPREDKRGDYFADKVTDRIAKGMHGEFDQERREIALRLMTKQKDQEHKERMERKRAERRQKEAKKQGYEERRKVEKGDEEEEMAERAERLDREGWAGFNEDGTLRPKSGMDPHLERRFRLSEEAQAKRFSAEDELQYNSDGERLDSAVATTSDKVLRGSGDEARGQAASAAEYFQNKDASGRFRSPAKKTVSEAFGRSKSRSPKRDASPASKTTTTRNRETNFGEMIARAKGEAPGTPQLPWTAKLQQRPGTGKKSEPEAPIPSFPYTQPIGSEYFLLRDADRERHRLVKVRKTTYQDPGNPFTLEHNGDHEVLLEQKPDEDSNAFIDRTSRWLFAHEDAHTDQGDLVPIPKAFTRKSEKTTMAIPPVPTVPDDFQSRYVPPRAGWVKLKPKPKGYLEHKKISGGRSNQTDRRDDSFDERRDTAFYKPFHEIEDMYRSSALTSEKSSTSSLKDSKNVCN